MLKFALVSVALFTAAGALYTDGFCLCQLKYLSEKERILGVLQYHARNDVYAIDGKLNYVTLYPDGASILKDQPACCRIANDDPLATPFNPESSRQVVFGIHSDVIRIEMERTLKSGNGSVRFVRWERTTNCGRFF